MTLSGLPVFLQSCIRELKVCGFTLHCLLYIHYVIVLSFCQNNNNNDKNNNNKLSANYIKYSKGLHMIKEKTLHNKKLSLNVIGVF